MQTWSEAFKAHIEKRFGEGAQQKASIALKMAQSKVHYWCHGSRARAETRLKIQRWSKGEVPADAGCGVVADESGEHPAIDVATGTEG